MILPDADVLVAAHRRDMPDHAALRNWLEAVINADAAFGLSELVVSRFLMLVTNAQVFRRPTSLAEAMVFAAQLRDQPNRVAVAPGPRHWEIFAKLCASTAATGNVVRDAYFAAMAIEHGCEWITTDANYSRFAGLVWRHPLAR